MIHLNMKQRVERALRKWIWERGAWCLDLVEEQSVSVFKYNIVNVLELLCAAACAIGTGLKETREVG